MTRARVPRQCKGQRLLAPGIKPRPLAFPSPRTAYGRTVAFWGFVAGYSGASASDFHRLPVPLRTTIQSKNRDHSTMNASACQKRNLTASPFRQPVDQVSRISLPPPVSGSDPCAVEPHNASSSTAGHWWGQTPSQSDPWWGQTPSQSDPMKRSETGHTTLSRSRLGWSSQRRDRP